MSQIKNTLLFSIFETHLSNEENVDKGDENFSRDIVLDYLLELQTEGVHTPEKFKETLIKELQEEVLEMLKKKIYGHYNINEYKEKKKLKPKKVA